MTRWKRLFYYLMINIVVSACTTLVVLTIWERTQLFPAGGVPLLSLKSSSPTPPPVLATFQNGTATPEPTPTQELTTYQVQTGDTLSVIAETFGVTVEEIMKLNGIENASALGAGMVLFIPVRPGSATVESQVEVETEEANPTSQLPAAGAEPKVVIANIFGAGDLATERVRLERVGEGDLSLANWQLQDEDGNVFIFPQLTLFPGGAVDLYSSAGVNGVVTLYWGKEEPVWESGEIASVVDDQGNIQTVYTVP